jgi:hypothetical protein
MLRANALVAGPQADFADQVRAAQAIAMLSDPVVLFADAPAAELRTAILAGVDRLFAAGPDRRERGGRAAVAVPAAGSDRSAATVRWENAVGSSTVSAARRSRRGRPPAMSQEKIEEARRLRDAGQTPADIARALGVSRATLYRHLAGPD